MTFHEKAVSRRAQVGPAPRGRWCASPGAGNSRLAAGRCSLSPAQCKRLEGGLDKLKEASIQLDELNRKLAEQKIVLAEKSTACETLLEEIVTNTAIGECGRARWGPPQQAGLQRPGHSSVIDASPHLCPVVT